jgi:signal transduction histidine kinase
MGRLTILWTALARSDVAALEEAVRDHDAFLVHTPPGAMARNAVVALARGPVLAVAATDRHASTALSVGVDEVLRAGELTKDAVARAVERARARSASRLSPGVCKAFLEENDEVAFALLGAAFGRSISESLAASSGDCRRLAEQLPSLIELADDFAVWTSVGAETEEARRLVARRLQLAPSHELRAAVARLQESLSHANRTVESLRELSKGGESLVRVPELLAEIVDIVSRDPHCDADISFEASGTCEASISRTALVLVFGALIANAMDSIRTAGREVGRIQVRCFEAEGAVCIEVSDNGGQIPADLDPQLRDAFFQDSPRAGLGNVQDRIRRAGGDLVIDSDVDGSTVRIMLPPPTDQVLVVEDRPVAVRTKSRLD